MLKNFLKIFLFLFLVACGDEKEDAVKDVELVPVPFSKLDSWKNEDLNNFLPAIKKSCEKIDKISNLGFLDYSIIAIKAQDMKNFCNKLDGIQDNAVLKSLIEETFIPHKIVYKDKDTGTFTGYYEPELKASRVKNDEYKYPIYQIPKDLVRVNLKDFGVESPEQLIGKVDNGYLKPYFARSQINEDIKAQPLLWFNSKVDVFVMHIQGSAKIALNDNSFTKVGYALSNGHKFKGIGSIMQEKGLLEPNKSSMPEIKKWLEENPLKADELMNENPRYIFFREIKDINVNEGPIGAAQIPLTPRRSMAVDRDFIPLGSLLWLEAKDGLNNNLQQLVIAQDTGNAIKGAIRGDFFWGTGIEALKYAGGMKSSGKYYILLPK